MRSPSKRVAVRDVESELNLPPGFRFHPTDEELIVHYLFRKSQSASESMFNLVQPPSIIADVDLYKHDPWELPELALFGTKEWYFFTPRDRKYPNSSRPNRVTGSGYWKATGADKPIKSKTDPNVTVGIKKALVFYAGQGVNGVKTNWIMHEYRLALPNFAPSKHNNNTSTSKLNDWVLCRLYNKKNNPKEIVIPENIKIIRTRDVDTQNESQRENSYSNNSDSFDSFENSDGEFSGNFEDDIMHTQDLSNDTLTKVNGTSEQSNMKVMKNWLQEDDNNNDNDWLDSLSLEDLHHYLEAMPPYNDVELPTFYKPNQQ